MKYLGMLLFVGWMAVACKPAPKGYQAKVTMQIAGGSAQSDLLRHAKLAVGGSVLREAAHKLDLQKRWALDTEDQVMDRLTEEVKASVVEGTDLIQITASFPNRTDSVDVANGVAEAFRERIAEGVAKETESRLDALEKQIKAQEEKLEESRVKMLDTMEKYGIVDIDKGRPAWMRGGEPNSGQTLVMKMNAKEAELEAKKAIAKMRTTVDALRDLSGDELIATAVLLDPDNPTFATRYPEFQELQLQKEATMDSGLGHGHPTVVGLDKQIEFLRAMLLEAVDTSKGTLETKLRMAEQTYTNTKATKDRDENIGLKHRRESIEYVESKKNYELNKEMLNSMQSQLAVERIDARTLPAKVILHEVAY